MPLTVAQQLTKSFKRSTASSTYSTQPPEPQNSSDELRRSSRPHRPSTRKLESDAYQASSQEPSRATTPTPTHAHSSTPSGRKPKEKTRKQLFGKRGERPGRISQSVVAAGTASNDGSPEPIAPIEARSEGALLETQGGGVYEIVHISREEAVRCATNFLNKDASDLSDESLQKVLEEIDALGEEGRASPMDAEGGDAPTQPEPTEQVVLGGGHKSPAGKVTDDAGSQGADVELEDALSPEAPEDAALEEPHAEDSATEPEDEDEMVELGPGDSVSQQPPLGPRTFHRAAIISYSRSASKLPALPQPRMPALPRTPRPSNSKSNTNTIDESDEEVAPVRKRPRLSQPQPRVSSQRSQASQRAQPAQFGIFRPTTSKAAALPLRQARHIPPHSKPPPTSDVFSALTWAAEFAMQAARSRASTSQGTSTSYEEFSLLAQVLSELQSNLADSSLPLRPKVRYLSDLPQPTAFLNDNVARLEAEAALVLGKHIPPRNKPVLSDFPGLPRYIASMTIPELIATALAEGAYETFGTNDEWCIRIFKEIAVRVARDKEVGDPPRGLRGLIVRRISCFRGDVISKLRPVTTYLCGFINAPTTVRELQYNKNLAESRLPNSFHCGDPATGKNPYENPDIREYIATVLFHSADALGVVYRAKFSPMPIPTIAFFLTAAQHTIEEWKSGHRVPKELDARVQLKMYESHYLGLLKYQQEAPGRFLEFQEDLFEYGLKYAGVTQELHEPYQLITRAADIRPDSPATKARAKGKGRAVH